MPAVRVGDLFEVGLVVADLEAAIQLYHLAFGYTFSCILEGVLPTRDPNGDSQPSLRLAVSRERDPLQLEFIEAQQGTHLVPPTGTGLHHLGYYVDDLEESSKHLEAVGIPFVRGGYSDVGAPDNWVYHEFDDGTLIELVDRASAPLRDALTRGEVPDSPMAHRLIRLTDGLGG